MRVIFILLFFIYPLITVYAQTNAISQSAANSTEKIQYDTNKIALIPFDSIKIEFGNNITAAKLTTEDMSTINQLLNECISKHNTNTDSTDASSWYINLKKYKFQYAVFINSKGKRRYL